MEGEETENISKFEEIKNELLKAKSTDEKVQILEQLASAISDISGFDIMIDHFINNFSKITKLYVFGGSYIRIKDGHFFWQK